MVWNGVDDERVAPRRGLEQAAANNPPLMSKTNGTQQEIRRVCAVHSVGVREYLVSLLRSIGYSSHARHVSIWFGFPASYDEYTALVKIGIDASEHVKRAVSGMYLWWILDTVTY